MFVAAKTLDRHSNSKLCKTGQDRVAKRDAMKQQQTAKDVVFFIRGQPIENVQVFKYLGRPMANNDDDLPAVRNNLAKARAQ